jgi:hypothetical protein
MQESAGAAGIHQQSYANAARSPETCDAQECAVLGFIIQRNCSLIKILDSRALRLLDEKVIDVRSIPVRIGNSVVGLAATSNSFPRSTGSLTNNRSNR